MKLLRIYIFTLLIPFLTSCLAEDLSDCAPIYNLDLQFVYTGDGTEDIFLEKIEQIEIYVFNEEKKFIRTFHIGYQSLNQYQGLNTYLPAGEYTLVCWGNIQEYMNIPFVASGNQESYQLVHIKEEAGERLDNSDPLYYGTKTIQIKENESTREVVSFVSAHINIEIYVEGAEIEVGENGEVSSPSIILRGLNSTYDFDMNTLGETVNYYPQLKLSKTGSVVYSELDALRFNDNNPIVIEILSKNGDSLHSLELKDFMEDNNIHVEGFQEVTIPVYIQFKGVDVNISVPNWDDKEVKPDL